MLEDLERGDGTFTGVSPDKQNELISCVDSIITDQIMKEVTILLLYQYKFKGQQVSQLSESSCKNS